MATESSLGLTRQGYRVGNADILQILAAQRLDALAELGVVNARGEFSVVTEGLTRPVFELGHGGLPRQIHTASPERTALRRRYSTQQSALGEANSAGARTD